MFCIIFWLMDKKNFAKINNINNVNLFIKNMGFEIKVKYQIYLFLSVSNKLNSNNVPVAQW